MQIQEFNPEKHYQILRDWWKNHKWDTPMPISSLSDKGVIIFDNDIPVSAGWLYTTNSNMAILGFPVVNPKIHGDKRQESIEIMIEAITKIAKLEGFDILLTYQSNSNLIEKLQNKGYKIGDPDMTNLIKVL